MTTLRISITAEVLEATKDCDSHSPTANENCAIAYAVRHIWPSAIVGLFWILPFGYHNSDPIKFQHYKDDFIEEFDFATPAERAAMQPFSFEIEVPDEVINDVNIDEIREILKTSKTLQIV